MKRIVILAALVLLIFHGTALAQERPPLAMRIIFEWTALGTAVGAAAGIAVWLTDPGNPNFSIARSVMEGVGWGTVGGAAFGVFVMQKTMIRPPRFAQLGPLDPSNRITGDPAQAEVERQDFVARANFSKNFGKSIQVPLFKLRF